MKVTYDPEVDVLHILFRNTPSRRATSGCLGGRAPPLKYSNGGWEVMPLPA